MVPVHPAEVLCSDDVAHFQHGAAVFSEDQGIEDAIGVVCFDDVGHLDVGWVLVYQIRVRGYQIKVPGSNVEHGPALVDADGLLDGTRQGRALRILNRNELERAALVLRGVPDNLVEIGASNHAAGRESIPVLQAHRVGGGVAVLALNGGDAHERWCGCTVRSVEDVSADRLALVIRIGHGYVGLVGGQRMGLVDGDGLLDRTRQGRALGVLHRNELERATLVLRGIPDNLVEIGASNHAAGREGVTTLQAHRVGGSLAVLALNGRDAHEGGRGFTVRPVEDPVTYDLALVEGVVQGDVGLVSGQRRRLGWSFPGRFQLH